MIKSSCLSKIPNLFIPGFDKCGTTTTGIYLSEHPQISLPAENALKGDAIPKEPMVFLGDTIKNSDKLYLGESYYRIDATPFYYKRPGIMKRICRYSQNPKIIILMRDPVERAISYWNHFSPIVNNDPKREGAYGIRSGFTFGQQIDFELSGNNGFLIQDGLYLDRLKSLRSIFDEDQTHYAFMEDLKDAPKEFFCSIFNFLEIDSVELNVSALNARERVFSPEKAGIERLRNVLYAQVGGLKELVGRVPDSWGEKTQYE